MANRAERECELVVMFSDEELREMSGLKRGLDYIEVMCGCPSHKYGDVVGRLRVFSLTLTLSLPPPACKTPSPEQCISSTAHCRKSTTLRKPNFD